MAAGAFHQNLTYITIPPVKNHTATVIFAHVCLPHPLLHCSVVCVLIAILP